METPIKVIKTGRDGVLFSAGLQGPAGPVGEAGPPDLTTAAALAVHAADHANPHAVTAAQVGLGNVQNTALSTWPGSGNLTTLGSIASQLELTSQSALNGTSAMTRDLMDARTFSPDVWEVDHHTVFGVSRNGWRSDDRSAGFVPVVTTAPGIYGVVGLSQQANVSFGLQMALGAVDNNGTKLVPPRIRAGSRMFFRFALGDSNIGITNVLLFGWLFLQMEASTGKIGMNSYNLGAPWGTMTAPFSTGNFSTGVYYEMHAIQLTSTTIQVIIDEVVAATREKTNRFDKIGTYNNASNAALLGSIGSGPINLAIVSTLYLHELAVRIPR